MEGKICLSIIKDGFSYFSLWGGGGCKNFRGGGDDHMKNYAEFNIIIVDFIRIVIVFFKYNTFYFTYPPPPPHDNMISAIFCCLVCFLSPSLANIFQLLNFYIIIND